MDIKDYKNKKLTDKENFNEKIFIWIDILGFREALEDDKKYDELNNLLKYFENLFNEDDNYSVDIISDGIILELKYPISTNTTENITKVFKIIGQKQWEFIYKKKYFIRGGIAIGSRYNNKEKEKSYIGNGLSRAVKMEENCTWPIIGTNHSVLEKINNLLPTKNSDENFDLLHTINANGEDIYFIDFVQKENNYVQILIDRIKQFNEDKQVKIKYLWLLKYYKYKFGLDKRKDILKELDGCIL